LFEDLSATLERRLSGLNNKELRKSLGRILLEIEQRNYGLKSSVDHSFTDKTDVKIYLSLYRSLNLGRAGQTPINAWLFGRIPSIDINKISDEDIVSMRMDHELFFKWREMVHSALAVIAASSDPISAEQETTDHVQESARKLKEELSKEAKGRGVLSNAVDGAKSTAAGVVAGAVTAAALSGNVFEGMIRGGIPPFLKMIWNVREALANREQRQSLQNHFLALGI
jgi:hypothetical protein